MNIPFVDLYSDHKPIKNQIKKRFAEILDNSQFVLGHELEEFEKEFAAYCEAVYAIGVDSGTGALELSLRALDIGPGDEVITVSNTFTSTAAAIRLAGAKPVFVDVDPGTWTMDPNAALSAVTGRTKAVLPVHLYGQPAEIEPLRAGLKGSGIAIIEDACQAHGARYNGHRTGSLGAIGCFSFYPSKNLGAMGDGGAVVTSDSRLAKRIRMLRNYGQKEKSHHEVFPLNKRLDNIQAAVLRIKLQRLDEMNARRRTLAGQYDKLLDRIGIAHQFTPPNIESVCHLYVILHPRRERLRKWLLEAGIHAGVHYPVPVHLQKPFADLGYGRGSLPVTEKLSRHVLSLPLFPRLSKKAVEYVAAKISEFPG